MFKKVALVRIIGVVLPGRNNRKIFVNKSEKIHHNRYNYDKVKYVNSKTKVTIICPIHGEFDQIPNSHLCGHGCPKCHYYKDDVKNVFISKAQQTHKNRYNYDKVKYVNSKTKVIILCPKHGEFKQSPVHHLTGGGCSKCRITDDIMLKQRKFISDSNIIHGNKYEYHKVTYINNYSKVIIVCPSHGEFFQTPNNHIKGQGCSKCFGNKRLDNNEFIKRAKNAHGNLYNYNLVSYINSLTKVIIICSIHGKFEQKPHDHLNNHGCPICARLYRNPISEKSQRWLDTFLNLNILRERTIKIGRKSFIPDGFDPQTNTVYEFDGDFWHGNPKKYKSDDINPILKMTYGELYSKTINKIQTYVKCGFKVIQIWESEWDENSKF